MSNCFKKNLPLLLILIQMITACDKASKNPVATTPSSRIVSESKSAQKGFYKHLKGSIGDLPVTMDLVKTITDNGMNRSESWIGFSGYYAYDRYQEPIMLSGTLDSAGMIVLEEYGMDGATATFKGNITAEGAFIGTWQDSSKKRSLPVALKETYVDGALAFESHEFVDSFKLFSQIKNSPVASFGMDILFPSQNTEGVVQPDSFGRLRAFLKNEFFNTSASDYLVREDYKVLPRSDFSNTTIADLQKAERDTFFKIYKETMADEKPDSSAEYAAQNHAQSSQMQILHNENGLLSMAFSAYAYAGGAHGNYGTSLQSYDVKGKKVLKRADILQGKYQKTLNTALAKAVRKHFDMKPNQPLNTFLFDNRIEANDNFAVTRKGIIFNYTPYEIAAYAMGEIQLFIPFEDLKGFVKNF